MTVKNEELGDFLKAVFEKEIVKKGKQPIRPLIQHIYISKILVELTFLSKISLFIK